MITPNMKEATESQDQFVAGYPVALAILESSSPAELSEKRAKAIRSFTEFGIPTVRDEEYKYLPLHALNERKYRFGFGANVDLSIKETSPLFQLDCYVVAFVNGQFSPEFSNFDRLPEGLTIETIEEASDLEKLGSVATLQGRLGSTNDERFVALNTAYLAEGVVIHVSKSKSIEKPIHVLHMVSAEEPAFVTPRIWISLEENAQAKLIESYIGHSGEAFTCAVTEVTLAQSAVLEHIKYQDEAESTVHIANIAVHQESKSVYTSTNVNFGGEIVRNEINVWINGEHTETWLNGTNVATGNQLIDNHTRLDHAMPNCQSFEVYKTILKDRAEGVFNGKIFVYEDAQKTDAKQTNQALLLSPTATMNTKPQLEIFADDVKCTHGATIGQLRDDALFYLRARGVEKSKAEALLVYAFAAEVIEKVSIEPLKELLEARLFDKLA